ncbi:MAG: hypothetical protein IH589_16075 [Anaerolineales bacterium]|nr:hypothetical protein [Anaerolineales bacterium]
MKVVILADGLGARLQEETFVNMVGIGGLTMRGYSLKLSKAHSFSRLNLREFDFI